MSQLQPGLLVGGEPEGDADQGVDVVAGQQGQRRQLVLSGQNIFKIVKKRTFTHFFWHNNNVDWFLFILTL